MKLVSVKLRLKLFPAVVTPTLLHVLASVPVGVALLQKVDLVQRKMLRNIVGWVRKATEPWEDTMRRMKQRVEDATAHHPIQPWSEAIVEKKQILNTRIILKPASHWSRLAADWQPKLVGAWPAGRKVGRPKLRWDSAISKDFRAFETEVT